MLHLNTIFEAEGLDAGKIYLIRHKDSRFQDKFGKSIFDIWHSDRERFEIYQSIQKRRNAFAVGGFVASFVVTNTNETLFVGLYAVESRRDALPDEWDTSFHCLVEAGNVIHELRCTDHMNDYVQRLAIEPWADAINYVKNADKCNPRVKELKRSKEDEPFPTYMRFRRRVADLNTIFPSWRDRLKEAKGVYLLTFSETDGQQYVGSASGNEGFWQRWSDYLETGHGGNKVLIRENRNARQAIVSILEVAGSSASRKDIIEIEMNWQSKLGSRAKRLEEEIPAGFNKETEQM